MLGITSIDPTLHDLLFERFVSQERKEPPDINVDFEHQRRETVMQWVFDTYGCDHAALCRSEAARLHVVHVVAGSDQPRRAGPIHPGIPEPLARRLDDISRRHEAQLAIVIGDDQTDQSR